MKLGRDNILSLLSRKDFGNFRQSLKRQHIHTEYAGKNSLLHYTVTSRDAASVEHVLNLGVEGMAKIVCLFTFLQRFLMA